MTARVFVALASYRDPDLDNTIQSLLDTAAGSIRIGLVDQGETCTSMNPAIDQLTLDPHEARGTCWARHLAHAMREGEPWTYQCDSHIRMREGWDDLLIADMKQVGGRSILTAYPTSLDGKMEGDQSLIHSAHFEGRRLVGEASIRPADGSVSPSRGLVSASSLFAPSAFFDEVPYDPYLVFAGEEDTLGLRAWTHDWDIWSPSEQVQQHDYDRKGAARWWTDYHQDGVRAQLRGSSRLEAIQNGDDLGVYGVGVKRSVADYERHFGVSFADQTVDTEWT